MSACAGEAVRAMPSRPPVAKLMAVAFVALGFLFMTTLPITG